MGKEEQIIMVIPRKNLFGVDSLEDSPQGFLLSRLYNFSPELNIWGEWKRRGADNEPPEKSMESNPFYKQPIAYSVIFDPQEKKIFAYQRLPSGHETRLANKWSFGIGGHVEESDEILGDMTMDIIERSRTRELLEEINIQETPIPHFLGYINDDFDDVGSVHFGLVYLVNAPARTIKIRDELKQGAWKSIDELIKMCVDYPDHVERWSALIVEPLEKYLRLE